MSTLVKTYLSALHKRNRCHFHQHINCLSTIKKPTISQYNGRSKIWVDYYFDSPPSQRRKERQQQHKIRNWSELMINNFLPQQYEISTPPNYMNYAKWQFLSGIASSTSGVLSMQALLYAIGLGAGAIPLAAALNWVIKDGLGQLGGIAYASVIGNRFDANPKKWRMISAVALDVGTLLEVLTPLFPASFLLLASTANIGKNVAWLSASATRAGIHQSFALKENLADITAKAGSQSIAASTLGMGLGIGLSSMIGSATSSVCGAFCIFSAIHLFSVHRSLNHVSLPTLNPQRLGLLIDKFIQTNRNMIASVDEINRQEQFISFPWSAPAFGIEIGSSFQSSGITTIEQLDQTHSILCQENYLLSRDIKNKEIVHLLFEETATNEDVLRGFYHAKIFQLVLSGDTDRVMNTGIDQKSNICDGSLDKALQQSYDFMNSSATSFIGRLHQSNWHCDNLFLENRSARYLFPPSTTQGNKEDLN